MRKLEPKPGVLRWRVYERTDEGRLVEHARPYYRGHEHPFQWTSYASPEEAVQSIVNESGPFHKLVIVGVAESPVEPL